MIKCNVTVCGTISTAMLRREQTRKEIRFCLFRYVTIPDRDGQNEVIEISVSKDGSQEEASGLSERFARGDYRNAVSETQG